MKTGTNPYSWVLTLSDPRGLHPGGFFSAGNSGGYLQGLGYLSAHHLDSTFYGPFGRFTYLTAHKCDRQTNGRTLLQQHTRSLHALRRAVKRLKNSHWWSGDFCLTRGVIYVTLSNTFQLRCVEKLHYCYICFPSGSLGGYLIGSVCVCVCVCVFVHPSAGLLLKYVISRFETCCYDWAYQWENKKPS